ncbi:hypothetical protein CERZMDRAFT_115266 [Cercospora zeae-maydis SCOH1-5]|uniref:Uncharacterized protein n=1 Tax=Cercospora zeae-maydis SCOH1-5 TaxID=717836 RepID=A0A6A6F4H9_9PEZI|nr:hypothetical protein CERZMDRAFT_115266 [Cercospora zeae-maydis SCOH1-5]
MKSSLTILAAMLAATWAVPVSNHNGFPHDSVVAAEGGAEVLKRNHNGIPHEGGVVVADTAEAVVAKRLHNGIPHDAAEMSDEDFNKRGVADAHDCEDDE